MDQPQPVADEGRQATWRRRAVAEAGQLDFAVYSAVAQTSTPSLDRGLRRLSRAANYSRLSLACAALLSVAGGRRGRLAARLGLSSVAVTSAALNLGIKPLIRRTRPDRAATGVPGARHVKMPTSTAFPSGHSAAAFAFATGVGRVLPAVGFPSRALATMVAYSRVHTGVHYPGDVVAGAILGGALAQATTHVLAPSGRDLGQTGVVGASCVNAGTPPCSRPQRPRTLLT